MGWIGVNLESVGVDLGQSWCNLGWLWGNLGQTGYNLQRSGAVWGQIWGLLAPFAAHSWHFPTSSAPFSSISLPQIPSFPKIALFPPKPQRWHPAGLRPLAAGRPPRLRVPAAALRLPRSAQGGQSGTKIAPQKSLFFPQSDPSLPRVTWGADLGLFAVGLGLDLGSLRWTWGRMGSL